MVISAAVLYLGYILLAGIGLCSADKHEIAAHYSQYERTCFGARSLSTGMAGYCPMVNWLSASMFNKSTFNVYNPGKQFTLGEQSSAAANLAETILRTAGSKPGESACSEAIQRFACTATFPFCSAQGGSISSVSYLPPCHIQCEQVNDICRKGIFRNDRFAEIDCGDFPMNHNCLFHEPLDRILLDPVHGPYENVPAVYVGVIVLWVLLAGWWIYVIDVVYVDDALPIARAVSALALLRCGLAAMSLVFWVDCARHAYMCKINLTAGLLLMYPFLESAQMMLFLSAASGWGTTRMFLSRSIWRFHLFLVFGFFISLMLLTRFMKMPSTNWVAFLVATYGLLYGVVVHSAVREMAVLNGQVQKLSGDMHAGVVQSIVERRHTFIFFLLLLLAEMVLEGLSRYILATHVMSFFSLVVLYELTSTILLVSMAACFMPRKYSPFYFIVPTSLEVGELALVGEGGGGMVDGEDEETSRVRRALTRRHRNRDHWEEDVDIAGIERLRFARSQRPSPIVETYLRGSQWWLGMKNHLQTLHPPTNLHRQVASTQEVEMGLLSSGDPGELVDELGSSSIDLSRLIGVFSAPTPVPADAPAARVSGARTTTANSNTAADRAREWGLGGDHALAMEQQRLMSPEAAAWISFGRLNRPGPTVTGTGGRKLGARVVALTNPTPNGEDADVILAAQHIRM